MAGDVLADVFLETEGLVMTLTNAIATDTGASGSGPRKTVAAELLDVKDVALLLGGCSTRHVYRLADAGLMPRPVRLGHLVRWRRAELKSWIDAGCPGQQHAGRRP